MDELEALLTRLDDAARRVGKALEAPERLTVIEREQAIRDLAYAERQEQRAKEAIRNLFDRERRRDSNTESSVSAPTPPAERP